jgi:hypothetical protein
MNRNETTLDCRFSNTEVVRIIWQIGAFLLPVIGLPGHFLMFITIINTDRRKFHAASLYYIFISLTESIYLLFLFWDWFDAVNLLPDPRKILNCAYFYPFVHGPAFISLLLVVQLNLDRVHMIKSRSKLTTQHTLIKIFLIYTTWIFFFLHYRYSLEYSCQHTLVFGQSCRVYNYAYYWFYSIWPYIHILCRLIPCLIIISCTIYVCRNRSDSKHASSIHRQQKRVSIVLLCLSIHALIAILPLTILQLFNCQMSQYVIDYRYSKKWKLVNALLIMWEATTYMNKFYVRFIVSSQFRRDVKQTILSLFNCLFIRNNNF